MELTLFYFLKKQGCCLMSGVACWAGFGPETPFLRCVLLNVDGPHRSSEAHLCSPCRGARPWRVSPNAAVWWRLPYRASHDEVWTEVGVESRYRVHRFHHVNGLGSPGEGVVFLPFALKGKLNKTSRNPPRFRPHLVVSNWIFWDI